MEHHRGFVRVLREDLAENVPKDSNDNRNYHSSEECHHRRGRNSCEYLADLHDCSEQGPCHQYMNGSSVVFKASGQSTTPAAAVQVVSRFLGYIDFTDLMIHGRFRKASAFRKEPESWCRVLHIEDFQVATLRCRLPSPSTGGARSGAVYSTGITTYRESTAIMPILVSRPGKHL